MGRGGHAGCALEVGKNVLLSKAPEKEHPQRCLWGASSRSPFKTQKIRVASSWRTRQYTPQAGGVTIGVLNDGKVVPESLAISFLSQVD